MRWSWDRLPVHECAGRKGFPVVRDSGRWDSLPLSKRPFGGGVQQRGDGGGGGDPAEVPKLACLFVLGVGGGELDATGLSGPEEERGKQREGRHFDRSRAGQEGGEERGHDAKGAADEEVGLGPKGVRAELLGDVGGVGEGEDKEGEEEGGGFAHEGRPWRADFLREQ